MSTTPFLDQLDAAKQMDVGIFLIDQFLSTQQADVAFDILNNDFPWELKPTLYGQKLFQHAYHYIRNNKSSTKRHLNNPLVYLHLKNYAQRLRCNSMGKFRTCIAIVSKIQSITFHIIRIHLVDIYWYFPLDPQEL